MQVMGLIAEFIEHDDSQMIVNKKTNALNIRLPTKTYFQI